MVEAVTKLFDKSLKPAVVKLPKGLKARKPSKGWAFNPQLAFAIADGLVTISLITISLGDLTRGIQIVTGIDAAAALQLAIAIDVKFVTLELIKLGIASDRLRKTVTPWVNGAVIGLLLISAGFNGLALGEHAPDGFWKYVAWGLGPVIPALAFVSTQVLGKIVHAYHRNKEA